MNTTESQATIAEAIRNEASLLHSVAHRARHKETFISGATDCLMQMYENEILDEDAAELTAQLEEFWRNHHA